jgi:hypothetical protein
VPKDESHYGKKHKLVLQLRKELQSANTWFLFHTSENQ